jgi:hypothetical protein
MKPVYSVAILTILLAPPIIFLIFMLDFSIIYNIIFAIVIGTILSLIFKRNKEKKDIIFSASIVIFIISLVTFLLILLNKIITSGELGSLGNIANLFFIPPWIILPIYLIGLNISTIFSWIFPSKKENKK